MTTPATPRVFPGVGRSLAAETRPARRADRAGPSGVDAELAARFEALSRGDVDALGRIYELCSDDLYGLALWRTGSPDRAGEVVQTVFVRLAERRDLLLRVRSPRAYLFRMAHRAALDLARAERRFVPLPERRADRGGPAGFLVPELSGEADPERALAAREASRGVASLPPKLREAVWLHLFGQMTFAEAGRVMGVPAFTAASRYRLAVARLRRIIGAGRGPEGPRKERP